MHAVDLIFTLTGGLAAALAAGYLSHRLGLSPMASHAAATQSRELFTLCVLVLALGIAVGSAVRFGVSMALGAFLAGIVVGRSDFSVRAASDALPMRNASAEQIDRERARVHAELASGVA